MSLKDKLELSQVLEYSAVGSSIFALALSIIWRFADAQTPETFSSDDIILFTLLLLGSVSSLVFATAYWYIGIVQQGSEWGKEALERLGVSGEINTTAAKINLAIVAFNLLANNSIIG